MFEEMTDDKSTRSVHDQLLQDCWLQLTFFAYDGGSK
jgi:hypothetical protein